MAKIQPIGERVLIRQKKSEGKTASGIYLPDSAREKRNEGTIIAVGTYEDGRALPVKAGDHVIYGGYSSEEIEIDGEKCLFVDWKDVLAKVEEE
ncbi:chaperonin GroES [Methanofollis sp. W23]|uniref:co-chaperone GroES n=1 Tax=Methanofollis sp. W23 TaxID=2817849 RepID=UPI001AE267EC|nr:co-chaperone GroES [Methanofollis sp. W23]MBP2145919.1 chaperonin GroES [Methanofollis sp. W23]